MTLEPVGNYKQHIW